MRLSLRVSPDVLICFMTPVRMAIEDIINTSSTDDVVMIDFSLFATNILNLSDGPSVRIL